MREEDSGAVADYIPELAEANPDQLGVALCSVTGHLYSAGDAENRFTIQSISKPFVYALALQELGLNESARSSASSLPGRRLMSSPWPTITGQ